MNTAFLFELLTNLIMVILTLFVLSRIFGDNPAFRMVQYLFVGVSLGYGFIVLYYQVLVPTVLDIINNLDDPVQILWLSLPFLLLLFFIPRIMRRQTGSWLANIPLGVIFGVGVALAFVGALVGTLLPQMLATITPAGNTPLQLLGTVVLALGVIATLSYFHFTVPGNRGLHTLMRGSGQVGRWLLMVAFGFFFASALITYLTALSERFDFFIGLVRG
jgi:hypothetical protein